VFRGSVVDEGECVLRVRNVGLQTVYGKLYEELSSNEDERDSPLQAKLQDLADGISMAGYIGATFIAISFLFKQFVMDNGYDTAKIMAYVSNYGVAANDVVTSLILAVIIIVVAVPEGLPMMIAIVLSLNMRKLLQRNVLVRRLLGIETAGSVDLLFVDKTGTLTLGTFVPQAFVGINGKEYANYEAVPRAIRDVLGFTIRESTSAMISEKDQKPIGGNASDRALLSFLGPRVGADRAESLTHSHELLFNSSRKFSATELTIAKGATDVPKPLMGDVLTLVKGAPEVILEHSTLAFNEAGEVVKLTKTHLGAITNAMNASAHEGVRTIAVAAATSALSWEGEGSASASGSGSRALPDELILIGVIGIYDAIRPETKSSLQLAAAAGIQVVMITGDRRETAEAVARQIDLMPPASGRMTRSGKSTGSGDKTVVTSAELQQISDERLMQMLPNIAVISRALPTDKSRLVKLAKKRGSVVGMTGDGVNDSAALKKADVGFAMGSGSEVAKEAADIVILDDNFASITQAVLYGRTIFKSIRKFIVFQSTVNVASMLIVFLGPFFGFDFPLTLIQLLWVNLVMDTLAALAFGGEAALPRYMNEKPIRRKAPIISGRMWSAMLFGGISIGVICILVLMSEELRTWFVRDGKPSEEVFLTAFFALFIFLTNFNAFNVRTTKIHLLDNILANTGFLGVIFVIFAVQVAFTYIGGSVLRTVGLTLDEWIWVVAGSAIIIPLDLVRKMVLGALSKKPKRD
jgi:P-type Ca2+ transporter type 2C